MIKGLILQRDFNVAKPLLLLKSGLLNCFVQGKLPLQNLSNEHHQKLVELKTTLRNSELHFPAPWRCPKHQGTGQIYRNTAKKGEKGEEGP